MRPTLIAITLALATAAPTLAAGEPPGSVDVLGFGVCLPTTRDAGAKDASRDAPVRVEEGSFEGCVGFRDGEDWFVFAARAGDLVEARITPLDCGQPSRRPDLELSLRTAPIGLAVQQNLAQACTVGRVGWEAEVDGDAWLVVQERNGPGRYRIDLAIERGLERACAPQDDAGSGRDATPRDPVPVSPGVYAGCLDAFDATDDVTVDLAQGDHLLRVTYTSVPCGGEAWISRLGALTPGFGGSTACGGEIIYGIEATVPGAYVLTLRRDEGTGSYGLVVEAGPEIPRLCAPFDDGGSGRDASIEDRVLLATGSHRGCVDEFDDADGYLFPTRAGEMLVVDVFPDQCDAWYDVDGPGDWYGSRSTDECNSHGFVMQAEGEGTAWLDVWRVSGRGGYTILIRSCGEQPPFWSRVVGALYDGECRLPS